MITCPCVNLTAPVGKTNGAHGAKARPNVIMTKDLNVRCTVLATMKLVREVGSVARLSIIIPTACGGKITMKDPVSAVR